MSRKDVPAFAIGKPSAPAPTPAELERFVSGEAPAAANEEPAPASTRAPSRAVRGSAKRRKPQNVIHRAGGRDVKRSVLYLPPELHKRLAVRCAELGETLSDFVAEAVSRAL